MEQVRWAKDLACELLAETLPARWQHTQGVGRTAESIAHIVGTDADLLSCAAWLHDIGYAPNLTITDFHPLDGARFLRDAKGVDLRLCRLVANHSFAIIEARKRGLDAQLSMEFPPVPGLVSDALTYCDMTVSPQGKRVEVATRLVEILERYPEDSVVSASVIEAAPRLTQTTFFVAKALERAEARGSPGIR